MQTVRKAQNTKKRVLRCPFLHAQKSSVQRAVVGGVAEKVILNLTASARNCVHATQRALTNANAEGAVLYQARRRGKWAHSLSAGVHAAPRSRG